MYMLKNIISSRIISCSSGIFLIWLLNVISRVAVNKIVNNMFTTNPNISNFYFFILLPHFYLNYITKKTPLKWCFYCWVVGVSGVGTLSSLGVSGVFGVMIVVCFSYIQIFPVYNLLSYVTVY